MSIETTYKEILINSFIIGKLKQGEIPTAETIRDQLNSYLQNLDTSKPLFSASDFIVDNYENASATKYNNTFTAIQQDMKALFNESINLTKTSIGTFERWNLESENLEKRLSDLEQQIDDLLLTTQDTEGYVYFIVDNFTDLSLTDTARSDVIVDPKTSQITMSDSTGSFSRILLNNLEVGTDVQFKIRTSIDFIGRNDAIGATIVDPFKQDSSSWWTLIEMRKKKTVTTELVVKLSDSPISVSKIAIELHDSVQSSPLSVTPLYSSDNFSFKQLPTNTFTQQVTKNAVFSFSSVQATHVKFVLTKTGPDPGLSNNIGYQFGFKHIEFFDKSFTKDSGQFFISAPLSVKDIDGNVVEFSSVALEACERVEEGTEINYSVTASNDPNLPVDNLTTVWFPISPIGRSEPINPTVIDLGDLTDVIIGDTETVKPSYDGQNTDSSKINPASTFNLLSYSSTTVVDDTVTTKDLRYKLFNKNDRILNYQIKDIDYAGSGSSKLPIDEASLLIFRNIGDQGLADNATTKVRGIQRGWGFKEPYYYTIVQIDNPDGLELDVGDQPIIIDDVEFNNVVPSTVLTGKTHLTTGRHTVKVHKDNWIHIDSGKNTLSDLKNTDTLYPYNHKLLIEGYSYGSLYPSSSEKIYKGVDLFAQHVMNKISILDLIKNASENDYTVYALDRDAPNTHTAGNDPTRVFVVKVDDSNPDMINERYQIRFKLVNQRFKYLRLRAKFLTEDESITPGLDSYKLKLK